MVNNLIIKIIINNKKLSNYKLNYKINKRSLIH